MRKPPPIPADIEELRDARWRREGMRQVETAFEAERFIEQVGFAACLTDCRRPGPSLYVAVCGRRDAMMPRNPQKDEEASLSWRLKDEMLRRGQVYYAKLARGRATFVAPRHDSVFPRGLGHAAVRGATPIEQERAGGAARAAPRMGTEHVGSARPNPASRIARRSPGRWTSSRRR